MSSRIRDLKFHLSPDNGHECLNIIDLFPETVKQSLSATTKSASMPSSREPIDDYIIRHSSEEASLLPARAKKRGALMHPPEYFSSDSAPFPKILGTEVGQLVAFQVTPDVLGRISPHRRTVSELPCHSNM